MKYVGSKNKLSKYILPILLKFRKPGQSYVEPFVGGANIIDKMTGHRIAGDSHKELIAFWKAFQAGWEPPFHVSEEEYKKIKFGDYPDHLKGYVGFNFSFSGKWWGGYARYTSPTGVAQNFGQQAFNFVTKQRKGIADIEFYHCDYACLPIPAESLIYCDPPYIGTQGYGAKFDHEKFYLWCVDKAAQGHTVIVSEFTKLGARFNCIWSRERSVSLDLSDGKKAIESLFIVE